MQLTIPWTLVYILQLVSLSALSFAITEALVQAPTLVIPFDRTENTLKLPSTSVAYLTFDEHDLDSSGTFSTHLARRYETAGVILPCERVGPYRGACAVENVTELSTLLPSTANIAALHGGCLGVPGGFDAFKVLYHAGTDARLTLYSGPDCSGKQLGQLTAPAVPLGPGRQLQFQPLPPVGMYRAAGRARSIHLRARDGRMVGLDNVTIVREAAAGPGPAPPSLSLTSPSGRTHHRLDGAGGQGSWVGHSVDVRPLMPPRPPQRRAAV